MSFEMYLNRFEDISQNIFWSIIPVIDLLIYPIELEISLIDLET